MLRRAKGFLSVFLAAIVTQLEWMPLKPWVRFLSANIVVICKSLLPVFSFVWPFAILTFFASEKSCERLTTALLTCYFSTVLLVIEHVRLKWLQNDVKQNDEDLILQIVFLYIPCHLSDISPWFISSLFFFIYTFIWKISRDWVNIFYSLEVNGWYFLILVFQRTPRCDNAP